MGSSNQLLYIPIYKRIKLEQQSEVKEELSLLEKDREGPRICILAPQVLMKLRLSVKV